MRSGFPRRTGSRRSRSPGTVKKYSMNHRITRVRELLKRELSEAIQRELTFDGVIVTVNDVDVTPDLKQGHVFVGVIGDAPKKEKALEKLKGNRALLQKIISKRVVLKYTPQLHFRLDDSVARGVNVISIMDEIGEIHEREVAGEAGENGVVEEEPA